MKINLFILGIMTLVFLYIFLVSGPKQQKEKEKEQLMKEYFNVSKQIIDSLKIEKIDTLRIKYIRLKHEIEENSI